MDSWYKKNGYDKQLIEIEKSDFEVYIKKNKKTSVEAPRIIVVSYQPNHQTSKLLQLCMDSIIKFTDSPYELWIIDNNSPLDNIKWLDNYKNVNIAFIRTNQNLEGSFANALALEVGAKLIEPESKYLLSFHEDIVVCRYGWLSYLQSKINQNIRAAGFRLTKARVPEGVLHVCGYLIDFQLFKKLGLSYMPELPAFDVGDKAIYELRKNGYDIFATPNTFDDHKLEDIISDNLMVKNLNTTRAFNDKNEVIYMHLGRGVPKTENNYVKKGPATFEQWEDYVNFYLFSVPQMQTIEDTEIFSVNNIDPLTTMTKAFVDININKANIEQVLIMTSNNIFNSAVYGYRAKDLDNQNSYDCIVFPNILEKFGEIDLLLKKSYLALRKGGILLLGCPYIYNYNQNGQIMADRLWVTGYREVAVYQQGGYHTLRYLVEQSMRNNCQVSNSRFIKGLKKSVTKDLNYGVSDKGLSLGYCLRAIK